MAHRAGIATYTYQKFEKGESKPGTPANPGLYTLTSLANAFEISLPELVTYDGLITDEDEGTGRGQTPLLPGGTEVADKNGDAGARHKDGGPTWL